MGRFNVARIQVKKSLILVSLVLFLVGLVQFLPPLTSMTVSPQRHHYGTKHTAVSRVGTDGGNHSNDKTGSRCPRRKPGERVNVILIGHGRSGTSYLGQLFNQNPRVFYHFEPLNVVEKMSSPKLHLTNYAMNQTREYSEKAFTVLSAIFRCKFLESDEITSKFLRRYSKSTFVRSKSEALKTLDRNSSLDGRDMNELCRAFPKYTVVKLLVPRLPGGKIANLVPLVREVKHSQFKIVHIIRDPRAVVNSQASLGWFNESTFQNAARTVCKQTMMNLAAAKAENALFRCNYKRITYETLVTSPGEVMRDLYGFIGMTSSPEVGRWIDRITNLSRNELKGKKSRYAQEQNTTLVLAKWKSASPERNRIVEKECGDVMGQIGYKRIT